MPLTTSSSVTAEQRGIRDPYSLARLHSRVRVRVRVVRVRVRIRIRFALGLG